jgi:hypothetical protein
MNIMNSGYTKKLAKRKIKRTRSIPFDNTRDVLGIKQVSRKK